MISFVLRGQSMAPLLEDGAVLALEQVPATAIWPGQVIVFEVLTGHDEEPPHPPSLATPLSSPSPPKHPMVQEISPRVEAFLRHKAQPPGQPQRYWVAHRVLALQLRQGRRTFLTQGDNVPHTDGFVSEERVLGRVAARLQGQRWVPIAGLEEWWALRYARQRRMVRQVLLRLLRYGQRLGERWMSKLLQANPEIVFRQEEEEAILFHPESGQIQLLNETGALIYQLLDGKHKRDEILERLSAEYEAEREVLAQDLDEFLLQVEQSGLASVVK